MSHPTDVAMSRVIDVALTLFAHCGFDNTKLDTIALDSGMSKRMIHYHFSDKRGLYEQAVVEAMRRLQPTADQLGDYSSVPVEGIVRLINAIYDQFLAHPQSVRLILREGQDDVLKLADIPQLLSAGPVKLQLNRLLIMGQDAGAFRPGISAEDILTLVTALAFYRSSNDAVSQNLFHIDLSNEENIAGLRRLTTDAVLAFLTSNIPATGDDSYIQVSQPDDGQNTTATDIYDD